MKRPARFTQAEMARALRAVEQAGVRATIEVTEDGLRIVPMPQGEQKRKTIAREKEIML